MRLGLRLGLGDMSLNLTDAERLLGGATVLNDIGTPTYTSGTSKFDPSALTIVGPSSRRRRAIALSPTIAAFTDVIEPTRTNLLAPGTSEHFALWTNVAAAIIADGVATAPDGTLTASTIQDNDAASFSGARQLFTVANDGLSHCFSIDVKKTSGGTAPTFGIAMLLTGGTGVTINARINTDTGASNVSTLRVDDHGTFWRVFAKVTNNTTGNTTLTLTVYPAVAPYQAAPVSASDAASATGTAVVYGADLQKAEWPTTYVSNRNLLLQTYTLANAAWGKGTGYTVTDGQADRNGGTLASRVVYAGGSGGTVLAQSRAIAGGTANKSFTMSFWYKSTGGATQNFRADNVQGGVIDTYQILAATATWQQCVFTVTNGASAGTGNQGFNLQSVVADSAYDITISDIQLEYGTAASPSWATTTAVGLRAADALTVSLASLAGGGLSTTAGTLLAVVRPIGWSGDQDGSTFWHIARDSDASSDIAIRRANATDITCIRADGGGSEASNITHGLTSGVSRVLGITWDSTGVTAYANGVAGTPDTTLTPPYNAVISLAVGWNPAAANNEFSGEVLLLYIPRALTADEIKTISASIAP